MSLSEIITLVTAGTAVLFGGYHYTRIHIPDFELLQAEVLYEKCMRECFEVCAENYIVESQCKCSHCRKYIEDD
jgi:hypothetical protein